MSNGKSQTTTYDEAPLPHDEWAEKEIERLRKALRQLIADYEQHTPYTASAAREVLNG